MSIFKSSEASATPTAEELSNTLIQSQKDKTAAIQEAELIYKANEAYVIEQAQSRIRAIEEIRKELEGEQRGLIEVLQEVSAA